MAIPGIFPMTIYKGDSTRWQFKLWMDAEKTDPADLTGVTVKAEIRDKPKGSKVTPIECTIVQPNIVNGYLSAMASKAMTITKGQWDLQLTHSGGDVTTVLSGEVEVLLDIADSV